MRAPGENNGIMRSFWIKGRLSSALPLIFKCTALRFRSQLNMEMTDQNIIDLTNRLGKDRRAKSGFNIRSFLSGGRRKNTPPGGYQKNFLR